MGLTFNHEYPDIAWRLERKLPRRCRLVRNPKSKHDPNAVEVHVGKHMLGYLSRNMAKFIAPELDSGVVWKTWVTQIVVHPDNPDQPGIWLHAERVEA